MKNQSKYAFTLIELLIVIGILSILVVTILITLNPAEAQKKARDTKRLKDQAVIQAIILQWLNDGNEPLCEQVSNAGKCSSYRAVAGVKSEPCDRSWIRTSVDGYANLCKYTNTVPVDPLNNQTATRADGGTELFVYRIRNVGSDYVMITLLEAKSNANLPINSNDGGCVAEWYEVRSGPNFCYN